MNQAERLLAPLLVQRRSHRPPHRFRKRVSIAPASPWQNGYAESFHSKLRDEFLNLEDFESPAQAQAMGVLWKEEYNTERPHSSLGYKTPAEYAAQCRRYVPIEETSTEPPSDEQPHP